MIAEVHDDPEGLRRSALLRQLAELDRAEPPPELDHAVLELARRTVEAAPAARAGHLLRWGGPAAVTLVLAAIAILMLRPGPAVIGRRVAATGASEVRARPVSNVERAVPAALAPRASTLPDSHALYAIRPLRLRLLSTSVPPPSPKIGSASLLQTDARARVILEMPRGLESHPEEWLRYIRRLRAEGRTMDADRERAAFSKAYSRYPDTRRLDPLTQPLGK